TSERAVPVLTWRLPGSPSATRKAVAFSSFERQKRGGLENRACVVFLRSRIKDGEEMESDLSASVSEMRRPSDEKGVRWTERIITRAAIGKRETAFIGVGFRRDSK
ncbi:hypothetical protein BHE74_00028740, partial [Ensete ventricosum]